VNIDVLRLSILTVLADGKQHGYGLLRQIEELSGASVRPATGTLYRVLDLLERDGLIADDGGEVIDGRFRRYFALTSTGRDELAASVALLDEITAKAKTSLARRPSARPA
jgi:DNA-binding PadR family transcriptional regulator